MGYDVKMFVGRRCSDISSLMGCFGAYDHNVYESEGKKKFFFYYPDGNTKKKVPKGTLMSRQAYLSEIAKLELCCIGNGYLSKVVQENMVTFDKGDTQLYDMDGNRSIGEDHYGSYRRFVKIDTVIDALEHECANEKNKYRRFIVALNLLKSIKDNFESDVGCLFYGH